MDSFELNKVLGAVLATCLGLLILNLAAGAIFAPVLPAKPGFLIAVHEQPTAAAPAAKAEEPIATRLAHADVNRGKSISRVCMTCHTLAKGEPNKVGPNLWNVVDRPRASEAGFDYSAAMKAKSGKWSFEELDKFLTHPQGYIPGIKMTFSGIQNDNQRGDLIAYLRTLSDNPAPSPPAPEANAHAGPAASTHEASPPKGKEGG